MFVVSVNAFALLSGHIHGREAVDLITEFAVMPGIGALYHQVGGHDATRPCLGYGVADPLPAVTVRPGDTAGLVAFQYADIYGVIVYHLF